MKKIYAIKTTDTIDCDSYINNPFYESLEEARKICAEMNHQEQDSYVHRVVEYDLVSRIEEKKV